MTTEQLRSLLTQGIDEVFGRPLVLAILSTEQKKTLLAQREFWSQPDAPLDKLLAYYLLQEKGSNR